MKGVQFLVNEDGEKTAVFIDLKKNPDLWEDIFDKTLAKSRKNEPREPLESVKRRLESRKSLRTRG